MEDQHSRLLCVQVKSTGSRKHHGYAIQIRGSQGAYPASAYDFLAAYVIPDDIWFIIPEELIRGSTTIIVAINGRKYSPYLEAWKPLLGAAVSNTSTETVIEVP